MPSQPRSRWKCVNVNRTTEDGGTDSCSSGGCERFSDEVVPTCILGLCSVGGVHHHCDRRIFRGHRRVDVVSAARFRCRPLGFFVTEGNLRGPQCYDSTGARMDWIATGQFPFPAPE